MSSCGPVVSIKSLSTKPGPKRRFYFSSLRNINLKNDVSKLILLSFLPSFLPSSFLSFPLSFLTGFHCVALDVLEISIDRADLKLRDLPASASRVLELKAYITMGVYQGLLDDDHH